MAYLLQVGGQPVVEVLHGPLLIADDCRLVPRHRPRAEGECRLGDAGPVTPRSSVHAGCAAQEVAAGGDAGLSASEHLQPSAQAHGAGARDAAGAGEGAGARDTPGAVAAASADWSHGERWMVQEEAGGELEH